VASVTVPPACTRAVGSLSLAAFSLIWRITIGSRNGSAE
jgi:hypothetical protein